MNIIKSKYAHLDLLSKKLRKRIIETSFKAKIPHLGSCLSCIDLLVYLYWMEMKIDPSKPNDPYRDRFVLSKGHGAPALFQVLAEKDFFPLNLLKTFGSPGSFFHEHPPKPGFINGIEAATGSLGHGLPMALGMALASKITNKNYSTYVVLSDGECNEGSIWEAAMLASGLMVSSLTIFIDFNKWQATGRSKEIMALDPLVDKWKAFGWDAYEINGHNFYEINQALNAAKLTDKPSAIIANTIKGKGVSFMEDNNNWHYKTPSEEEFLKAIKEIEN